MNMTGRLRAFGAIARQAPKSSRFSSENSSGPIYPAAGSKIVTPTLLVQFVGRFYDSVGSGRPGFSKWSSF